MALTWVSPTDDIIFHEGVSAYNFQASGTIKGGQLVKAMDTMKVGVLASSFDTSGTKGIIGVAAYDVTDKEYLAIWGPGNIVRCKTSGAVVVGDRIVLGSIAGHVGSPETLTYLAGAALASKPMINRIIGMALESKAADASVRVLLI